MKLPALRRRKRGVARAGVATVAVGALGAGVLAATGVAGAATPGPVFRPDGKSYDVGSTPVDSAAADLDGDGDRDLAVANEDSQNVSVLMNQGDGTFAPAQNYYALDPNRIGNRDKGPNGIVAADFNEDGAVDLATSNPVFNRQVSILINNGDGTFQPFHHPLDRGTVAVGVGLTAGDFDGDGHVDLVVGLAFDSALVTLLGNGDGTFHRLTYERNGYTYPDTLALDQRPAEVMSADFDGDGILDVAVLGEGRAGETLLPLLGDGDGRFHPAFRTDSGQEGSYSVGVCYAPDINDHASDFNGDGIPDLAVVTSCSGGETLIFLGNGDGTFTRGQSYPVQAEPTSVAAADFTGDGITDLAISKDARFGKVSVLVGAGDGTFQPATQPPFYRVGQNPLRVTPSDLNGDDQPDLVAANAGEANVNATNTVTVLLNAAGRGGAG